MAKNKNRKQSAQNRSSAEAAGARAKETSTEAHQASQATPGDMARKGRERRFGHN
ncbi:hypothetical protein ABZV64_00370 [Streptomyces sp. NPDC004959]|uniref:hypothetical protein n=1 Tax=unclassified Streptomyces TaxID=2593676 RepID=UPI000A692119|nr:hypothetical protein [Streptomyces sp. NRRL F-5630]